MIMVIKLNKRDQKLLKILDLDARQSNIQIAKKLKISKNVVNYNIKRLEDEKLIKGYNTLVNASKLGYFFFRVYVDFYERDINVDDELIKYLIDLPEAGLVARVVGEWDVLIGFYVEKVDDFQKVWNKVLEKFRKHVKHFNIALVTEQISFRRSYLTDEKKDISEKNWVIDEAEKVKVDDLDLNILKMLAKNARTPIKDIALKTKMGSMAIIYRIKQLINKKVIIDILKEPIEDNTIIHSDPELGIINGLYATTSGSGGIIPIQIFKNLSSSTNDFELKLTGKQGDVMKESVECSYTAAVQYIGRNLSKYKIKSVNDLINNKFPHGFHVHAPSTSTPKDGPSAGCAFTSAFVSRMLNKKIRNDVAMTGEVELTGRITKIGGLNFKLLGAKRAGVKQVYVPLENKKDLDDIKQKYKKLINKNFKVDTFEFIDEIIDKILV